MSRGGTGPMRGGTHRVPLGDRDRPKRGRPPQTKAPAPDALPPPTTREELAAQVAIVFSGTVQGTMTASQAYTALQAAKMLESLWRRSSSSGEAQAPKEAEMSESDLEALAGVGG